MKKLRIYLDTSVINFLFADDAPEFKRITADFFSNYINKYEVFVSEVVIFEINKTQDENKKKKLLAVIETYPVSILETRENDKINKLAEMYLVEKIIPKEKREDALHLAISTIYEFDILLSWNFKHLANIKKQILINALNEREGYLKKLNLLSPLEVEFED